MATPRSFEQAPASASAQMLQPVQPRRYLRGCGNLLRKETGQWWGTRVWWVHALIWLGLINGFITFVVWAESSSPQPEPMPIHQLATLLFFQLSLLGIGIGAIITAQGAIIGEKQRGTAAWVLSKPVSRGAFVLAKLVAHTVGFAVLGIALPSLVFYGQNTLLWDQALPLIPFLAGNLVSLLNLLFYLALSVMLGTFFGTRGPVAGIALGFLLAGHVIGPILPQLAQVMPWSLPNLAGTLAQGQPLGASAYLAIAGAALGAIVFVGVALWRFRREEF